MKLAIMQPYFFPYIGYWQLIHAVDTFILFDDVQYIRHGWVNRNRVLKHGGGWQYITAPLRKHAMNELIKNIYVRNEEDWKNKILRQLDHYNYGYKNRAPFYRETIDLLESIFSKVQTTNLTGINGIIVKEICGYLDITTRTLISSSQQFNYENVQDAGEWAVRITEQMNAQEYINPIAGIDIFDTRKFQSSKIKLSFLKSEDVSYAQGVGFEPSLSIVDVLMFNGQTGTKNLLSCYSIKSA